jgi:hypothetical protein
MGWLGILESNLPAVVTKATKLLGVSKSRPSLFTLLYTLQALIKYSPPARILHKESSAFESAQLGEPRTA